MPLYTRGTAIIEHSHTSERFQINADELEWEPTGGSERSMGPETMYQALVDHDELGELRWTVTEYPVGAENFKGTDVGKHRLVSDFDYGLEWEPEFEDDYPADPYDQVDYGFEDIEEISATREPIDLGSEQELITRGELLEQIAALKAALPKPTHHGGMGHNQPPAEFELEIKQQVEIAESLDTIEVALTSDQPDVKMIAKKSSVLNRIIGWIGKKLGKTAEEFCKSFGSTLGTTAGIATVGLPASILASPYWGKLVMLLEGMKEWLLLVLGL